MMRAGWSVPTAALTWALVAALLASLAPAARAEVRVVDDAGHPVALPAPARRIVSMAPHLTELLFSAGAGDLVVGAVAYSDYPEAARTIARIGDSTQLDLERVVALRPDLIVVWRDGNSAVQLARLRGLGLPIYENEVHDFADVSATLRRLGTLAGTADRANAAAAEFEQRVAALRAQYAGKRPLRVFYQIWHAPLVTVNGQHLISHALALCGARNVFADLGPLTPTVSVEAVVAADPDAIVAGRGDGADAFAQWRRLPALRAVRQQHLIEVNPDLMHRLSTRIVLGAGELCAKLDAIRDGTR